MVSEKRYFEIIQAINNNEDPKGLNLNEEEQKRYNSMIKEKEEFKERFGTELHFDFPFEMYNNLGI